MGTDFVSLLYNSKHADAKVALSNFIGSRYCTVLLTANKVSGTEKDG